MKSLVVTKTGGPEVREIPAPVINEKQALVKTVCCGICNGTDAKLIHRSFKGFPEEVYPIMLGHEAVGKVVETGSAVTKYKKGDIVLLPFVDADKELYGELNSGWGGYSEYGVVHDEGAYPKGEAPECAFAQTVVPDYIDPVDAAMVITLREVLSSIRRFGIKEEDKVVVFGCGPVGQTFIRFLKLLGVKELIAFDVVEEKLADALEKGADHAFNSTACDVRKEVRGICPEGVDYVLDAVGITAIINQGMELIRDGGKICCYGISPKNSAEIDWSGAPYNWTLQFQQFPSKAEEGACTEQIYGWIKDGTIDLKDYISDYFAFDDILTAFEKLEKRRISKKGIVVF
ncbi:MAG: zinc-binding dehydrogenase [Lachnospiraceae bacterium]|jgi:L-iditol 2-dehydrogenase|nr:zinc-binding dehydrogenase [Lachnospiraceae bacterium]